MELLNYRRKTLHSELEEYISFLIMLQQPGAAGGEAPPKPWVLTVYEDIQEYGVLWADGGIGDQPYYLMGDLKMCAQVMGQYKVAIRGSSE